MGQHRGSFGVVARKLLMQAIIFSANEISFPTMAYPYNGERRRAAGRALALWRQLRGSCMA